MSSRSITIDDLRRVGLSESVEDFLRFLAKPTLIKVPGRTSGQCRLVVTLLHGNEPSGVIGCHRYLRQQLAGKGDPPRTDLYFFIANVELALTAPRFTVRQYRGQRDLNRCFHDPGGDQPGEIAAEIIRCMESLRPEAVVDIHNTSGSGPSFSVCRRLNPAHLALTALFTHRIVITDLTMGALIDLTTSGMPVVTIECGGAGSESSHQIAHEGILRFADSVDPLATSPDEDFDIYHHPVRLELEPDTKICFADDNEMSSDITLPRQIDNRNFGVITPDIPLGWVNNPACLQLRNGGGDLPLEDFFAIRHGRLYSSHPLKLFMVTTNPVIALSDCLLYAVKELDHSHLLEQ